MKLPEGVTINIEWHGDDRMPIVTAGELRTLLVGLSPDTPVFIRTTNNGDLDCIQIGGESRG